MWRSDDVDYAGVRRRGEEGKDVLRAPERGDYGSGELPGRCGGRNEFIPLSVGGIGWLRPLLFERKGAVGAEAANSMQFPVQSK